MKLILFLFFSFILASCQDLKVSTSSKAYLNEPSSADQEPNILKGWLKFFTFIPDFTTNDMPTKFDYNPAYQAQYSHGRQPELTDSHKDQYGYFDIPSDTSFFFVLTSKTLYVINSRRVF